METTTAIAANEFQQIHGIISLHRSRALQTVNNENLLTAWEVGVYVSSRLKNSAWGSKTVMQLSEYLRSQDPTLRGYSRRTIYKMVALYETYSSAQFLELSEKLKLDSFYEPKNQIVPPMAAQFQDAEIVPSEMAQFKGKELAEVKIGQIVQATSAQLQMVQFVPPMVAQMPNFLNITSLTNHFVVLDGCQILEERIFYVLYAYKEKLNKRELERCLKNHTLYSLMGDKHNLSKGLKEIYPQALPMLKDKVFIDFLGLPQKHSEKRLQNSILDNMKDFVLELGKDFLFYDKEFPLQVGNSTFKVDLLFFHRGLQCLVAIELKTGKFKPEYMGQLEFYLEALDRDVRRSNENPSIGILLCQEADRSVVEYAMSRSLSPTMIAEYERQLIPKEVLKRSLEEFTEFLDKKKHL
ncbi:MAG: PDDEXK nuclease domain-containing protein [Paludibacter sp.]|jgi:predicted nuclease of restriction endonuclease-like (RecB) superfamily|nr:PDDEXK nuclease domain-containing protein [Paludibacter sp.]